jgi:hypothetical protein
VLCIAEKVVLDDILCAYGQRIHHTIHINKLEAHWESSFVRMSFSSTLENYGYRIESCHRDKHPPPT